MFPDPILRSKTKKVVKFDERLRKLLHRMDKAVGSQKHGIGIAAPQIGVARSVAIVDVSARVKSAKKLYLVNPTILDYKEECSSREGCMSIPDYTAHLKRYHKVHVQWQNEYGVYFEKYAEGIEAICFQHEIDHLNGVLFIDRVSYLKRDMMPRPKRFP